MDRHTHPAKEHNKSNPPWTGVHPAKEPTNDTGQIEIQRYDDTMTKLLPRKKRR